VGSQFVKPQTIKSGILRLDNHKTMAKTNLTGSIATIMDEGGVISTTAATLNFVGTGVMATVDGGDPTQINVAVTGGGGGGGGPVPAGDTFTCPGSVAVKDVVYISASGTVDKAFAGSIGQTPDAIGIVDSKPTSTSALVIYLGRSSSIFSGLTPNTTYFLSATTPGAITATAPTATGTKVQEIGQGLTATVLFVDVDATSALN
jgi:hypothetical protein